MENIGTTIGGTLYQEPQLSSYLDSEENNCLFCLHAIAQFLKYTLPWKVMAMPQRRIIQWQKYHHLPQTLRIHCLRQ